MTSEKDIENQPLPNEEANTITKPASALASSTTNTGPPWVGILAALALVVAVAALVVGSVALAENNDKVGGRVNTLQVDNECSGYGHLHDNKCHCDDGYELDAQDPFKCNEIKEIECGGHGHLHGTECHCDNGYELDPQDSLKCNEVNTPECGGHGHLHGTECHCDDGYQVDPAGDANTCVVITTAPTEPYEECSGHGHTHGDWCHCDDGFLMEPGDPLRCSFAMWDPCATAFETGEFDIRMVDEMVGGATVVAADVQDGLLVMGTVHSERGIEIFNSNGKLLRSHPPHPNAMGTYGVTMILKLRGDHTLGYFLENQVTFEGAYGFRHHLKTGEFELFDAYTEMNINTTGWSYLDQAITDEDENGNLIGYYYDGDVPAYKGFMIKDGNYSALEVPGATGHVFPWTFAGPEIWAGRAKFNSTFNPAHWINVDGTNLELVAPFDSTLASIDDAVVDRQGGTAVFKGVVGYYRDPATDSLPFDERTVAGFIADRMGNVHSIQVPDAKAVSTMIQGVTDRCTIVGTYTDGEGISGSFIGIPKEPGRH